MTSRHYTEDRKTREELIQKIGTGFVVNSFVVDKGHKNGPERHEITSTGIIIVYNNRTNKMVTKLIARPNQIRRYYKENKAPKYIIAAALDHQKKGYNNF